MQSEPNLFATLLMKAPADTGRLHSLLEADTYDND